MNINKGAYPDKSQGNSSGGLIPGYGVLANVNSSHRTIPYDQTSDCVEKILSVIHSIASHFTGRGLCKINTNKII